MKTIVITGSTRGIGLGMAHEFLKRNCNVVVCGRSQSSVDAALAKLGNESRVLGQPCDVTDIEQVQALWDAAAAKFGKIDIWINNAGRSHDMSHIWEMPLDTVHSVLNVNLNGVINGSRVAIAGMYQQGGGHLYNMDGFGSHGRIRVGMSVYGTSKRAVHYLTKALVKESAETPVKVSHLSPGMVMTDMLTGHYASPEELEKAKRIFNILADKVETVTPWLAEQVLANQKSGANIAWLTGPKIAMRFMTAPFKKRDLFA